MNSKRLFLILILLCVVLVSNAFAEENLSKTQPMIGYKVAPNVIYGQGAIVKDGKEVSRDLWMDVYEPAEKDKKHGPQSL